MKKLAVFSISLLAVGIASIFSSCGKPPILKETEPQNNCSIRAATITVKGTVNPASSTVLISGDPVIPDKNGNFAGQVQLRKGNNRYMILAINGNKSVTTYLTINRTLTDEEKSVETKAAAEKAAADAEAKERANAGEAAFLKTPAEKLCAKHLNWTRDECTGVASHQVWIGMTYEMLKASRGLPDLNASPSNYGAGNIWQWCWSTYTPHCVYGGDNGIIIAYN